MPTADEILAGLTTIAREQLMLAIAWHGVLVAALLGWWRGWRPSRRVATLLLAAPLASVSTLAWFTRNPFNGTIFGALTITLLVVGARASRTPVAFTSGWVTALGCVAIAFAWLYPHFLDAPELYLVGAPMGLLPCPTLSLVLGIALAVDGIGSTTSAIVLVAAGLFYAAFGILRLHVWLDAGLLTATVALLVRTATTLRPRSLHASVPPT